MLLTGKSWRMPASGSVSDRASIIDVLLKNRNITDPDQARTFLSEDGGVWHDPFLYNDMQKAVDLINEVMDSKGKILVYGDYDCDGVTATAILVRFFRSHHADVSYLVPQRAEHGYGLTEKIMDKVISEAPDLVITVDCGITNLDTVEELEHRGIKVIVSDHHNVKDEIPAADCVICSKREDNTYPFTDLCGAGVALKILEALGKDGRHKVTSNLWRQAIELAGIATIADLVSMTDENRTIIKQAFRSMQDPANVGVKVMNEMLLMHGKALDETFISFNFVPRVNAAGRLYDSSDALDLFLENNPAGARTAAMNLTKQNDERKEIEAKVFEEAQEQLENPARPEKWSLANICGPIVVYGKNWHQGVLGIVAGKLSQFYNRSAIVLTDDAIEPEFVKGSGRSFGDYDLYGALTEVSDTLANFGGHKKAAGMMVRKTDIEKFMDALEEVSRKRLEQGSEEGNEDILNIDCELPPELLSLDTYETVRTMRPFGIGNPKPVFMTKDLIVSAVYPMSEGAHIRLDLTDGRSDQTLSAVGFGMGAYLDLVVPGDKIDIAYSLNEFCFRGETSLSLHLCDIKLSGGTGFIWSKAGVAEKLYSNGMPVNQIAKMAPGEDVLPDMIPHEADFGTCYRAACKLAGEGSATVDCDLFAKLVNVSSNDKITPFRVKRCLEIFADCGLLRLGSTGPMRVCFSMLNVDQKVKLSECEAYKRIMNEQK